MRRKEEWVLEPIGEEETGTGQLVGLVQVVEPWPAAAVAAYFSVLLAFLNVPSCFHHPGPIHRAAAAVGIGTGGAGSLQVLPR